MTGRSYAVTELTKGDVAALRGFECARHHQPWSRLIQAMIRSDLVDALREGRERAIGVWTAGTLVGVGSFKIRQPYPGARDCFCSAVGVQLGYQGEGIGRTVKGSIVAEAEAAGARCVVSYVHRENEPMLRLNSSLGGEFYDHPSEADHLVCVIPLPRSSFDDTLI